MIEIIKPGLISQVKYQNTCHECGCIYTYEVQDIMTYDLTGRRYVLCPTCHKQNEVFSPPGYVFDPYKITCNYDCRDCCCDRENNQNEQE